jgi:hypothetical protein
VSIVAAAPNLVNLPYLDQALASQVGIQSPPWTDRLRAIVSRNGHFRPTLVEHSAVICSHSKRLEAAARQHVMTADSTGEASRRRDARAGTKR